MKWLFEFSKEEIETIQVALLYLPKKSSHWERAQELLKQIPLPPPEKERLQRRGRGQVQDQVVASLQNLGFATALQIAEFTELDIGIVASTLTRLCRKEVLDKKLVPNPQLGVGRGKRSVQIAEYFLKKSKNELDH